jgi:hypothetical protein
MRSTDSTGMEAPRRTIQQLKEEVASLEKRMDAAAAAWPSPTAHDDGHIVGFSTSVTDDDNKYLDLCAELFARERDGEGTCSET